MELARLELRRDRQHLECCVREGKRARLKESDGVDHNIALGGVAVRPEMQIRQQTTATRNSRRSVHCQHMNFLICRVGILIFHPEAGNAAADEGDGITSRMMSRIRQGQTHLGKRDFVVKGDRDDQLPPGVNHKIV